jgi:hypothetical protein
MVQGLILAAAAASQAKGILTFFASFATDIPTLIAATAALQLTRAFVASTFHQGGMVGPMGTRMPLGPDERPIIVKVGETVRTREQESRLRGGGVNIHLNFSGVVGDHRVIKDMVERGLRETGLPVGSYFTDTSSNIKLA